MIFIDEPGTKMRWLESLGVDRAREILDGSIPGIPVLERSYQFCRENEIGKPDSRKTLDLPRRVESKTERPPAVLKPSSQGKVAGATVAENRRFGQRLTWNGTLRERDLGDAMHRILAAEVLQANRSVEERKERAKEILGAFDLADQLDPDDVLTSVDHYRAFVRDVFAPVREEVEVPFSVTNANGQRVSGFIDHLLYLSDGKHVILDHKIFPGKRELQEAKALSYSGQLATYAASIGETTRVDTWIHFATTGVALRLDLSST